MNNLIVVKFGGTSVRDLEHLQNAARKVKEEVDRGNRVVAVVSAQAGVTDRLIHEFDDAVQGRERTSSLMAERDAMLAQGEQENAVLFAEALREQGLSSKAFYGDNMPLHVSGEYGSATVDYVETSGLHAFMNSSEVAVPVVPGFQGMNGEGRVMTIGRGGSDLTAVELAIALNARRCDIYTDVEGVFTADPRSDQSAQMYGNIFYGDMFDMARAGAKVLEKTCVERSMAHEVFLQVLSSRSEVPVGSVLPGTIVSSAPSQLKSQGDDQARNVHYRDQGTGARFGQALNCVPV
ncbi:MAG: hypothetical protein ACPG05_01285 [Bdellovibrionales bacterium]